MCRCLKLNSVLGKTQGRAVSTTALFFRVARLPQIATRVEKVSERITMWGDFANVTNTGIRRV